MNDEATGRLLMNTNHHNHHHVHIHQQQQHQINTNGKSSNNDFLKKPGKGWLHSDDAIQNGVMYTVKYIGYIGVKESMKSLSFDVRTQVARESIRRVAENAKLLNLSRRNRTTEEQVNKILSSVCITQWSGMNVQLHINTQVLKVSQLECQDTLFQHTMQNISFACGGDADIQDFVAYVAKDDINGRACYVFECGNNMANNVITTIGQAFELRFKKFLNSMPTAATSKPTNKNVTSPTHANTNEHRPALNINHNNATPLNHNHHHNPHPHHHHQPPPPPPPTSAKMNPPLGQMMKNFTPSTPLQTNTPQTQNTPKLPLNTNTKPEPKAQPQTAGAKIDEKLEKMPWFHGLLTRENAEKLLTRDGDYLVRETNKAEKQYVLSGRYKGECRHIFLVDPSGVIRTKDRVFDNICHLIQYHQDNKIPIISKENELLLEYPVFK